MLSMILCDVMIITRCTSNTNTRGVKLGDIGLERSTHVMLFSITYYFETTPASKYCNHDKEFFALRNSR